MSEPNEPGELELPEPDPVDPIEDVAADEGVAPADVTRYQEAEQSAGTGLLSARGWAEVMGHPKPATATLLDGGVMPAQPITWLLYHQLCRGGSSA